MPAYGRINRFFSLTTTGKKNAYDERLQFTYETEIDYKISFLDVLVVKNINNEIKTDWYMKPTFSGHFLNYFSHHPRHQKIAIIYNLVDRAIELADKKHHSNNIIEKYQ